MEMFMNFKLDELPNKAIVKNSSINIHILLVVCVFDSTGNILFDHLPWQVHVLAGQVKI